MKELRSFPIPNKTVRSLSTPALFRNDGDCLLP